MAPIRTSSSARRRPRPLRMSSRDPERSTTTSSPTSPAAPLKRSDTVSWIRSAPSPSAPIPGPGRALIRIDGNIAGATTPGHVLSVGNTLVDPDGMNVISYQWQANGADIAGATGATLTLGQELVGKVVTVVARYLDGLGTPESVSSAGVLVIGENDEQTRGRTCRPPLARRRHRPLRHRPRDPRPHSHARSGLRRWKHRQAEGGRPGHPDPDGWPLDHGARRPRRWRACDHPRADRHVRPHGRERIDVHARPNAAGGARAAPAGAHA